MKRLLPQKETGDISFFQMVDRKNVIMKILNFNNLILFNLSSGISEMGAYIQALNFLISWF